MGAMQGITPMPEQTLCAPRRVSFTQNGEDENNYEKHLFTFTQNRAAKKAVRFSPQLTIDTTMNENPRSTPKPWNEPLTEEHCKELWYQREELVAIKHAAKVLIASRMKSQRNPETSKADSEELVGLERFSKLRAIWKKHTIQGILMAQREMSQVHVRSICNGYGISKEDFIQKVSLQRTEWSREAAKLQGFRDYCAVHDPLAPLFSDSDSKNKNTYLDDDEEETQNYNELIFGEITPCTTGNKRQVDAVYDTNNEHTQIDNYSSGRRVRCRKAL